MGLSSRRMGPDQRITYYRKLSAKVKENVGEKIENLETVWDCLVIKCVKDNEFISKVSLSEAIAMINNEAVKKCETTNQLDFLTGTAKKLIISGLIHK